MKLRKNVNDNRPSSSKPKEIAGFDKCFQTIQNLVEVKKRINKLQSSDTTSKTSTSTLRYDCRLKFKLKRLQQKSLVQELRKQNLILQLQLQNLQSQLKSQSPRRPQASIHRNEQENKTPAPDVDKQQQCPAMASLSSRIKQVLSQPNGLGEIDSRPSSSKIHKSLDKPMEVESNNDVIDKRIQSHITKHDKNNARDSFAYSHQEIKNSHNDTAQRQITGKINIAAALQQQKINQMKQQLQQQLYLGNLELQRKSQLKVKSPDEDNSSESFAYLQQEIEDPQSAIVQRQVTGNKAIMLVMLENGVQRLITFEVPKEDCTVQDLLDQVNIYLSQNPRVSLVSEPMLGINYIVETSPKCEEEEAMESTVDKMKKKPEKNSNMNQTSATPIARFANPRTFYKKDVIAIPGPSSKPQEVTAVSKRDRENRTTSSDKEGGDLMNSQMESTSKVVETIVHKEPLITNSSPIANSSDPAVVTHINGPCGNLTTVLDCRTVRIGTYKFFPKDKIQLCNCGLRLEVPLLQDEKQLLTLEIKYTDLVKVLMHFSKSMPVLFFYLNVPTGLRIRDLLGMYDSKGPFFDPAGKEHAHKRITLLPEFISKKSKAVLKEMFKNIWEELNQNEANTILVRASKNIVQNAL